MKDLFEEIGIPPMFAYLPDCIALAARQQGTTYREIGQQLGVSVQRARQMAEKARYFLERYAPDIDFRELWRAAPYAFPHKENPQSGIVARTYHSLQREGIKLNDSISEDYERLLAIENFV